MAKIKGTSLPQSQGDNNMLIGSGFDVEEGAAFYALTFGGVSLADDPTNPANGDFLNAMIVPFNAQIRNLVVATDDIAGVDESLAVDVMRNTVATALTATVVEGEQTAENTTTFVSVTKGDLLCIRRTDTNHGSMTTGTASFELVKVG